MASKYFIYLRLHINYMFEVEFKMAHMPRNHWSMILEHNNRSLDPTTKSLLGHGHTSHLGLQ